MSALKTAFDKFVDAYMDRIAKRNCNGLYWKKHEKGVAVFDCRSEKMSAPKPEDITSAEDVYKTIICHTVIFSSRKIVELLFGSSFAKLPADKFYELCDEIFDTEDTTSKVMQYGDLYLVIDYSLNIVLITEVIPQGISATTVEVSAE